MDLHMTGKVALVTGASRGIGAAVARALAAEGCTVALTARSEAELRALAAEIGTSAMAMPCDLRDPDEPERLIRAITDAFGKLHILVANAGSAEAGDFLTLEDDAWLDAFSLKFFGHMRLIRTAWPLLARNAGAIAMIAGFAGRTPPANGAINGTINGALLSLTKALANRGVQDGVRVNAVNPGQIRTARFERRVREFMEAMSIGAAEAEASMARDHGMLRTGEPQDVADLVAFMVSGRASFLHGALIDLDGGMTKTV